MLRQVIDWAASRSTELLTRYKQMATNIGFSDNFSSYEYNGIFEERSRKRHDGKSEGPRPRGRRTEWNNSREEPFQPCLSRKRRRRQARRQENRLGTVVPNNVATGPDGKRRCSPAGCFSEEVQMSSGWLMLGRLRLWFDRRIRLPSIDVIQTTNESEWDNRETYAQIVKTPKVARDEWLKQLNTQTEVMTNELDKWMRRFRIFSVSVEVTGETADGLGDSKGQDTLKQQILVQRLKQKLREYFGEIVQFDELVVEQDGTKHKSMHFGPSEDAVEREIKYRKSPKKTKIIGNQMQKEPEVVCKRYSSVVANIEELEDSFSEMEDKFWSKQDHYLKRKSGKASRKRLREPVPCASVSSKKEIASMETECVVGTISERKCELEIRKKRGIELADRKLQRRDAAICISENSTTSNSLKAEPTGPENAAQSLPKRMELMQAKYRRFMKKLEKSRKDANRKLQTVDLRR